jgi:hypothetical protein
MSTIELVCLVPCIVVVLLFGLSSIAPHVVDNETKQILLCDQEYYPQETVIHKSPKNIKEYTLNDGSSITVDATETEVQEKEVFDPFGFEVPDPSAPAKTPAEKIGGGMAEIIRKRREEGVF